MVTDITESEAYGLIFTHPLSLRICPWRTSDLVCFQGEGEVEEPAGGSPQLITHAIILFGMVHGAL